MKIFRLVSVAALCAMPAFSQGFSSLTARVTDASGAAIVGAMVEATNLDNAVKRSGTSDDTGTVSLTQVIPGRYKVTATMAGFATATVDNVALVINTPSAITI